jgi:hypothetical protein
MDREGLEQPARSAICDDGAVQIVDKATRG